MPNTNWYLIHSLRCQSRCKSHFPDLLVSGHLEAEGWPHRQVLHQERLFLGAVKSGWCQSTQRMEADHLKKHLY